MTDPGTRRSTFWPTVLVGGSAAALAAVAAGRTWATARPPTPPGAVEQTIAGSDVAPPVLALALVALAAWGALLVLRRRARRVVAVLGALSSLGVVAITAGSGGTARDRAAELVPGDATAAVVGLHPWLFVTCLAGAVTVVGFGAALAWSGTWPELSGRYDAPGSTRSGTAATPGEAPLDETELWRALDDGRDPTG